MATEIRGYVCVLLPLLQASFKILLWSCKQAAYIIPFISPTPQNWDFNKQWQ